MSAIVHTAFAVLFTSIVAFAAPARPAEAAAATASAAAAPASAAVPARAASAPELGWHSLLEDTVHRVNADGTEVMTYVRRHKILKRTALSSMKETTISYSQSAQKLEVLEAYTIKPGGRRIDAPPANYQVETQSGRQAAGPAYSDDVSTTVVLTLSE